MKTNNFIIVPSSLYDKFNEVLKEWYNKKDKHIIGYKNDKPVYNTEDKEDEKSI